MAEHVTVDVVLTNGVYGVMAARNTVDVSVRVRAPLDSPRK